MTWLVVSLSLYRDMGLMACHSFRVGFVVDRVALGTWGLLCQYHSISATYPFIYLFIHSS